MAGFEAQEDAVEEALGKLVGDGFKPDGLTDELGSRWEITRNYFRLYACCNPIHPALDCLREALAELRPRPDEVERIEFATYRFASVMRNPDPPNYFASKYSLPHAAAVMVVRGGAGHGDIDDAALADPAIAALRRRVSVAEDPAMSALAPRLRPARVTVTLKDGRTSTRVARKPSRRFQRSVSGSRAARQVPRAGRARARAGGRSQSGESRGRLRTTGERAGADCTDARFCKLAARLSAADFRS